MLNEADASPAQSEEKPEEPAQLRIAHSEQSTNHGEQSIARSEQSTPHHEQAIPEITSEITKDLKIECMNDAHASVDADADSLSDDNLSKIYETLKTRQKGLVIDGTLFIGNTDLDRIFARLTAHADFKHLLDSTLVDLACDIYEGTYTAFDAQLNLVAIETVKNPIGAFLDCFKQAIPVYRAKLRAMKNAQEHA